MTPTKVILAGVLGEEFGREHNMFLDSKTEALRLLAANFDGFRGRMQQLVDEGTNFVVQHNGVDIPADEMEMPAGGTLVIIPTMEGAGGDFGNIVLGAAMIGLAAWNPMGWAALGTKGAFGLSMLMGAGFSLVVGSVVNLLAPQPKLGDLGNEDSQGLTSYYFNGAESNGEEGSAVTIIYGEVELAQAQTINAAINIK